MGWETRGGSSRYLTRTIRVDGGFDRHYYGRGPFADIAAHEWVCERDRLGASPRWRTIRAQLSAADELVAKFGAKTDLLLRATLLAAGFHNHRGAWRRRRKSGFTVPSVPLATDFSGLLEQAQDGHLSAVNSLKENLVDCHEIWQEATHLGEQIEATWHDFVGKKEPDSLIELASAMASFRQKIKAPFPSPIDVLLTERVALNELQVRACDLLIRPREGFSVPSTIQNLLDRLRQRACRRNWRARQKLSLCMRKLGPKPASRLA